MPSHRELLHHPAYARARDRLVERLRSEVLHFQHLRPVVFLCGGQDSVRRDAIKTYLSKRHPDLLVFFAEEVWEHVSVRTDLNALAMENELGQFADVLIVIVESPGTFTELGAFALSEALRRKMLPVVDECRRNDISFINTGPIRWIDEESRYNPTIFTDFEVILRDADALDERLSRIPRRGRLPESLASKDLHERPKHLLFLLCDIIGIAGPLQPEQCKYFLQSVIGEEPRWGVDSLLALGKSLSLIEHRKHSALGDIFFRGLSDGKLESFQRVNAFDFGTERARFLAAYRRVPDVWAFLTSDSPP